MLQSGSTIFYFYFRKFELVFGIYLVYYVAVRCNITSHLTPSPLFYTVYEHRG